MKYVIAGLGNPDKKYDHTRHNAGFDVIDVLAEKYFIRVSEKKMRALIGEGMIEGMHVVLVKPQTYMNLSGESIRAVMDYFDVPLENLVVISDDINLDIGSIRVRPGGSAGGHNGLKNIIKEVGSQDFKRVRVGVGRMDPRADQIDYVLSAVPAALRKTLQASFEDAADASVMMLKEGSERAMNVFNGKKNV